MITEIALGTFFSCCLYQTWTHRAKEEEIHLDELTRVYNRKILKKIEKEDKINKFIVISYDIDHFKNINDTYGHSAGDIVIQAISNLIDKKFRKKDYTVRMGGEEFISFVQSKDKDFIIKKVEEIKQETQDLNIIYQGTEIKITISIGISFNFNINLKDRIINADELLYPSKENGRNKITIGYDNE